MSRGFLLISCCLCLLTWFLIGQQTNNRPGNNRTGVADATWNEYRDYLFNSLRTSSENLAWKLANKENLPAPFIQLQYALNSTDADLEEPHLFSMGRYINSFTTYLELLLSDDSLDWEPFHNLRQRFFPWWNPAADMAYLPWASRDKPKTGIVLTVGQGNFMLAAHCIRILHSVLNSTVPIQVFYAGDLDLPEAHREQIKALHPSLETINILHDQVNETRYNETQFNETTVGLRNSGYAMKPFAALASSFERVILVDADAIFLRRPDFYFDEQAGLKETGIHYFHDRAYEGRNTLEWIKSLMRGVAPSETLNETMYWQEEGLEHQQESGVVMINKAIPSAFMSLVFTAYINTQKIRDHVYTQVFGDKETYWIASELSSAPYSFAPNYAGIIGNLDLEYPTSSTDSMEMCSAQPLHLDHQGRPFWFNSGLRLEKMIDSKEYVNLTHFLPGSRTTMDEQFEWRYRSHHTFCTSVEAHKWRALEEVGLKTVADAVVEEAKKMDVKFSGHEGGANNDR